VSDGASLGSIFCVVTQSMEPRRVSLRLISVAFLPTSMP